MDVVQITSDTAQITLSRAELIVLNNALNEICNGIDVFEFRARIGVTREEATLLLTRISSLTEQMTCGTE